MHSSELHAKENLAKRSAGCAICRYHEGAVRAEMLDDIKGHQPRSNGRSASAQNASPRVSQGSARSYLLTLLGEYALPNQKPIWTATLLEALVAIGFAEKAARQAIARAASAGWVEGARDGRRVMWRISRKFQQSMESGLQRVRSISREPRPWNGQWLIFVISLPDTQRAVRTKLYKALRWAGYGAPSAGLWVNPHPDRLSETGEIIRRFHLDDVAYVFAGEATELGVTVAKLVQSAWDWELIDREYDSILKRVAALQPRTPQSTFLAHCGLIQEWQQLPFIDPGLPTELLPTDWRGRRAAKRLEDLRDRWAVEAHKYWRTLGRIERPR
jgi:phenylacetic acid degradation operon negative regulatory protein